MQTSTLLARNLTWYWRTNVAVLMGVAIATGVLGGALLVGQSVRASLRDLLLSRLGNAESIVASELFFREQLADEIGSAAPIITIGGAATHQSSRRRASAIDIVGVDERFWRFQGLPGRPPRNREVLVSAALAAELGSGNGDTVLLRVEKPADIPLESLHGRKDDSGKTIRLVMSGTPVQEFSVRPQQGDVRAVYLSLERLQRELDRARRANMLLVRNHPNLSDDLKNRYRLEDAGLRLRRLEDSGGWSLESERGVLSDSLAGMVASASKRLGLRTQPVLTYLVNSIRVGNREIPYSLITATSADPAPPAKGVITLNNWAARDLAAKPGDEVTLEYYVWRSDGRLDTASVHVAVDRIVPINGPAADRKLAPDYPGITESDNLHDWDPPFPMDLSRIRPLDEQYWTDYRTTPKGFIASAQGRELWGSRFGSVTSIRIFPASPEFGSALRVRLDLAAAGFTVIPAKANGLTAAGGATDFGEYFLYFSFFLMVSALLLTGLFFKLGVEQRTREIGILRTLGFTPAKIRLVFLLEGGVLSAAGAVIGIGAALGYGAAVLYGLRTWWLDAVGTRSLALHVSLPPLIGGGLAGMAMGLAATAYTLRRMQADTPRALVAGAQHSRRSRWHQTTAALIAASAVALLTAASAGHLDQTGGFFGAGALLLIAALVFQYSWLRSRGLAAVRGQWTLGLRSAAYKPGRTILCIALIASAVFLIVSLDSFRREPSAAGTGGYPLLAESALPIAYDPSTQAGREALLIPPLEGLEFVPFRLRAGDDASCLNLYQPLHPRILAPRPEFLRRARFAFQSSVTSAENPWLLLESQQQGGAIPAIADANSMTYVLHRKLGEEFVIDNIRYRIVAALQDSIFQSELLISESNFLHLFPEAEGYRFFLLNAPSGKVEEAAGKLEDTLADFGFDARSTEAQLESYHRVENTYLSTFRALGALGLLLGTFGLAAVVLRNVLERRKELALLRAVGYRPRHLAVVVLAENLLILFLGLVTGTGCALLAILPAMALRGGHLPFLSVTALIAAVFVCGLVASLAATAAALRSPLLIALHSE